LAPPWLAATPGAEAGHLGSILCCVGAAVAVGADCHSAAVAQPSTEHTAHIDIPRTPAVGRSDCKQPSSLSQPLLLLLLLLPAPLILGIIIIIDTAAAAAAAALQPCAALVRNPVRPCKLDKRLDPIQYNILLLQSQTDRCESDIYTMTCTIV